MRGGVAMLSSSRPTPARLTTNVQQRGWLAGPHTRKAVMPARLLQRLVRRYHLLSASQSGDSQGPVGSVGRRAHSGHLLVPCSLRRSHRFQPSPLFRDSTLTQATPRHLLGFPPYDPTHGPHSAAYRGLGRVGHHTITWRRLLLADSSQDETDFLPPASLLDLTTVDRHDIL